MEWVALRWGYNCYIYLSKPEKKHLKETVKMFILEKDLTTTEVMKKLNKPRNHYQIMKILYLLLSLKVLRVKQKKRARIWYLELDWEKRLDKHLITEKGFYDLKGKLRKYK